MIEKVAEYMEQHHMVTEGSHICVGVSGGADSVCLFRILERLQKQMGFTMSIVHVEHGIRGRESLMDMEFVRKLAETYGIPFRAFAYPVEEIAKEQGLSVEEAGRKVRYEAFAQEAERYGKNVRIALAHHGDDNAETMLFHLCRGSGIEGLAGIRPVRGNIIRPLLCATRSEIEEFLKEEGQVYRTDATNADVCYSRNRIRSRIIPELLKVNEQALLHMNCLLEDVRELSEYLSGEVDKILKENLTKEASGGVRFAVAGLSDWPLFLQRQVMLELAAEVSGSRKDIGREHAKALLELADKQVGKEISLPYGITAEKTYGALLLYRDTGGKETAFPRKESPSDVKKVRIELPKDENHKQDISGKIHFPEGIIRYRIFQIEKKYVKIPKNQYTKWFDYDKIKKGLCFRNREPGDYFVADVQGHRKKLKDYLINEKVPKTKRSQILLLADGSHILWAVGYRISEYYKITENTRSVLEVQFMEDET